MITVENLEKELKSGTLQSLYLFYGEELFLLETSLKKIKSLFGECMKGINYITIDDTNIQELITDMETPSFGYEKKLIIARNTQMFKKEGKKKNTQQVKIKEKINQYLQENQKIIQENVILIFVEQEVDTKEQLYQTIQKQGVVCKFDWQKPYQIEKRLKAICNSYQVQIENSTLNYLIECAGTNMQDLINEIRKLIEYVGEKGTIQKQDIDNLTIKKLESIIFDLTDNLGKKQIQKALQVLKNLIVAKEPLVKILITLYNHFKRLYFVKLAIETKQDIITALKLKPNQTFLVNKYKKQASYFQKTELRQILQSLVDLDNQYKIGQIDLQLGLEAILCAKIS